jgi:hypothetical protein
MPESNQLFEELYTKKETRMLEEMYTKRETRMLEDTFFIGISFLRATETESPIPFVFMEPTVSTTAAVFSRTDSSQENMIQCTKDEVTLIQSYWPIEARLTNQFDRIDFCCMSDQEVFRAGECFLDEHFGKVCERKDGMSIQFWLSSENHEFFSPVRLSEKPFFSEPLAGMLFYSIFRRSTIAPGHFRM